MNLDALIPGYDATACALAARSDLTTEDLNAIAERYVRSQKATPKLSAVVAHLEARISAAARTRALVARSLEGDAPADTLEQARAALQSVVADETQGQDVRDRARDALAVLVGEASIAGPAPAPTDPAESVRRDIENVQRKLAPQAAALLTPRAMAHLERELGPDGFAAFRARFGETMPSVARLTAFLKERREGAGRSSLTDAEAAAVDAMDRVMGIGPGAPSVRRNSDGAIVFGAIVDRSEAHRLAQGAPVPRESGRALAIERDADRRRIEGMDRIMGSAAKPSPVRREGTEMVFGALTHEEARQVAQNGGVR